MTNTQVFTVFLFLLDNDYTGSCKLLSIFSLSVEPLRFSGSGVEDTVYVTTEFITTGNKKTKENNSVMYTVSSTPNKG